MKSKPLITVATVTYNAVKTLERTMQSVADQDYPRVEHLIVDGCSKDNTLSIVQRFVERNTTSEKPHSIRLICDHDEGLYDAMNKAISIAQGNYIVFLNAGDKLHEKTTLSSIMKQIEWKRWNHANPAIIYGETDLVDNEGNFIRHRRLTTPERLTSKSFLSGMRVCHQSFYVSTELAREIPYNLKYHYSADFDWCIRLMKMAEKRRMRIHNTHLILTDYLNEGLTTQNHRKSLFERLRIMGHHYGWPATILVHFWFIVRAIIKR